MHGVSNCFTVIYVSICGEGGILNPRPHSRTLHCKTPPYIWILILMFVNLWRFLLFFFFLGFFVLRTLFERLHSFCKGF